MHVIFSHGKESGPWGSKIKTLAAIATKRGHTVDSIDYTGIDNADERVKKLNAVLKDVSSPVILVGSSMGGYVSLVASESYQCKGVFLMAPALYITGYLQQTYSPMPCSICVVHGLNDEVIPYKHSTRFASNTECKLHLIEGDHRLNTSLTKVCDIFENFLTNIESNIS